MTVEELIKRLQELPSHYRVKVEFTNSEDEWKEFTVDRDSFGNVVFLVEGFRFTSPAEEEDDEPFGG